MGQSHDQGARSPSVPVSVQHGNQVVDRFSPGSGAHTCRARPSLIVERQGAERVLGNDPFVHGFWMWRMFREPRGAVLSFLLAPVCHTRSLKEGPCVPIACSMSSHVIAVDSQNQGGGLSSLMSKLGREVARNGPPAGGGVPLLPPRFSPWQSTQ